ncbi:MAG: dethiobiotin synthase [Candidatus Omnitrophota bacterium]
MKGFFITGTDTGIGKTLITSLLALGLRRQGVHVCPVKPIGAGGVFIENRLISEDVLVYRRVADIEEPASLLNPICFQRAVSPHFAAELEGRPIVSCQIIKSLEKISARYDVLLVEGVGGWMVPLNGEYLVADLAKALKLPILVASANRLGTLNHTLLTLASIRQSGCSLAGVVFTHSQPDAPADLARNNIETIEKIGKTAILGSIPFLEPQLLENPDRELLWRKIRNAFQWNQIIQLLTT